METVQRAGIIRRGRKKAQKTCFFTHSFSIRQASSFFPRKNFAQFFSEGA